MADGVVGVWKLRSFHMEDVDTGQRSEPFGPAPRGTLILHADGRMAALITPEERTPTLQSLVAYSGRYRLDPPDRLVTTVDVAWIDEWIGTDQTRTYVLEGEGLELRTPPGRMPRPGGGEMTVTGLMSWVRDGPSRHDKRDEF